jgi:hypothetical protein
VESNSGSSLLTNVFGKCPDAIIQMNGYDVCCLLDTGAQVSTITESYYQKFLSKDVALVDVSQLIHIAGTQGLDVPLVGLVEIELTALGQTFDRISFLVVKDPVGTPLAERKMNVPGVIGSNVFTIISQSLQDKYGSDYLLQLTKLPENSNWGPVLALYEENHAINMNRTPCRVRLCGEKPTLIPARSIRTVETTVQPSAGGQVVYGVVEEAEAVSLPEGIYLGPSFVSVDKSGHVPCQIVNFSNEDVYWKPRTQVGQLESAEVASKEEDLESTDNDFTEMLRDRVTIHEDLTGENYDNLQEVLHHYQSVFSRDDNDVGCCNLIEHEIPTTDDIPTRVPYRRIPPHQWPEVREYLRQALEQGIIRESSSPYAAPVVIVRKRSGQIRMCVDYRSLNSKTRKDAYPLPRIEETLEVLKGARYFCSLDLAHGYHQVKVAEKDIEKTAFRVGTGGLYEFSRMPFGLCNAPGTFMRLMDKVFGDQNFQSVLIYLDDILIFGSTYEETMDRLKMVLHRLQKVNLKVKTEKCFLFFKRLRYLGHIISEEGVSPDPEKIKSVSEWPVPRSETELRNFWGLQK